MALYKETRATFANDVVTCFANKNRRVGEAVTNDAEIERAQGGPVIRNRQNGLIIPRMRLQLCHSTNHPLPTVVLFTRRGVNAIGSFRRLPQSPRDARELSRGILDGRNLAT